MNDEIFAILNEQSQAIGRIESSLKNLVGNGQPGLIKEMRDDINSLKDARSYAMGFAGALTFLEIGTHFILRKLGLK